VYSQAKRYYAEIMMPFRKIIKKNLDKLAPYDIALIAPSHGPLYRRPSFILDAYQDWVASPPKNAVALPYVSMHDSTKLMVDYFVAALVERGMGVEQFNLEQPDPGKLAMGLVDPATIVIGTPTVLAGPHPNAAYAAFLANALRPKARFASVIGSYGWGGKTVEQLAALMGNLKPELLPPVLVKGLPTKADYAGLDGLADTIAEKHANLGPEE
ncbi:MAG: hypothetical protein M0Z94_18950, partial [Dehalococcoidales bacterium]|nr:hypothetical protein [Dehalococcoidales bacterium]